MSTTSIDRRFLTVAETAEYLNTSERFVRRLIAERRIAFHRVGRHLRFSMSDLEEWLALRRVPAVDRRPTRRGRDRYE
jgi:excisionase family DNA binding protein